MNKLWKTLVSILALFCLLIASAGYAQTSAGPNNARAREAYANGQRLFRLGEFIAAQAAFEEAYNAVPNPIVLLSIAECQVRMERFNDALTNLNRYLTERPTAPDRAQVEAQIAKLREQPGTVAVTSTPPGARVLADGVDTGFVTPTELKLAAGDHAIALELEGYVRSESTVRVEIGIRQPVNATLEAIPAEPAPVASADEPAMPAADDNNRTKTVLWIVTGVAVAGGVAGGVLGGLALKNKGEFDDAPTEEKADKGERLALFADLGFGVAAASAVTALVLYLTSRTEKAPAAQAFQMAPALTQSGAGVVGNLRF